METLPVNPENVRKVKSFVRCLLQNLDGLPEYSRISYEEQSIALKQLANEFEELSKL